MATSKTLTPTNVTIQIPEFTDQPDQRVNSNCLDKEADAINALNTQINPSSFSTSGLTFSSCTFSRGGYVIVGTLVIVNIEFKTSASIAQYADMVTGLPKAKVNGTGTGGGFPVSYGANCAIDSDANSQKIISATALNSGTTCRMFTIYIKN